MTLLMRPGFEEETMHHARSVLKILLLVGIFVGTMRAIAAEDISPPPVTTDPVNVVRQVAKALTADTEAIQGLRGPPIEHSNLDRLNLPTPGMDCGIARSLIYVACNSATMNKTEAEAMFARIIDDVQTALPSDTWIPVEAVPQAEIRRSSYQHLKSGARIDIDLMAHQPAWETQPLYWVRVYGWMRF
jgi:hypothetical protein